MRLKALFLSAAMVCALLSFSACGVGKRLEIDGSPASRDGVTVTLKKASAVRKTRPDRYEYSFSGTIENNSDEGVMTVTYRFALSDKTGENFRSFAIVYDGEEQAIPPHSSIPFSHEGIKWGAQSVPASVSISVGSVKTETELPPVKLPETGEPLYLALGDERLADIKAAPPVALAFHIDQGGYGRTAVFGPGPQLDQAVGLLCDIRIAGEVKELVSDNYNSIALTWEDGSVTIIPLNLRNLEFSSHSTSHVYTLQGLDAFWNYASDFLTEDGD